MASRKRAAAAPAKKKARKRAAVVKPKKTRAATKPLKRMARATRSVEALDTGVARRKGPTRGMALGRDATLAVGLRRELHMEDASRLVRIAAHDFTGSLETTLEAAGLISTNQRAVFREKLRSLLRHEGYELPAAAIRVEAGSPLRQVRDAVLAEAR